MFLERRSSCDPLQQNLLTKKTCQPIYMSVYLCSPFSGSLPPTPSVSLSVFFPAHLCICGPSYLCSGCILSAFSSRLTSLYTVQGSLTGLPCVDLLPTSCGREPLFHSPLVDSCVSLLLLQVTN